MLIERNGLRETLQVSREDAPTFEAVVLDDPDFYRDSAAFGVWLKDVTPALQSHFDLNSRTGVVVAEILRFGPAKSAGIEVGDLVTKVAGTTISENADLDALSTQSGEVYQIEVIRNGRNLVFPVTAANRDLMLAVTKWYRDIHLNGSCLSSSRQQATTFCAEVMNDNHPSW